MMKDDDLKFLGACSDDELEPLVEILLGKELEYLPDGKGRYKPIPKGRISSELQHKIKFVQFYPHHSEYVEEIVDELQLFGGNSLVNKVLRDNTGVSYREIASDVANLLKAENKGDVETLELAAWEKALGKEFEKDDSEKVKILCGKLANSNFGHMPKGSSVARAVVGMIKLGGFRAYQLNVCLANCLVRHVTGRGLSFAANATLTKTMSIFAGPLGWVLTGLWTIIDIAAPAYRVTVPAVLYIGALRQIKKYQQQENAKKQKRNRRFLIWLFVLVGLTAGAYLIFII